MSRHDEDIASDMRTGPVSMTTTTRTPSPNPHRVNACPGCGNYRADGKPPYLHNPGCPHEGDLQIDRFLAECRSGDAGGPPLWCLDPAHSHEPPPDVDAALDRLRNTATLPNRKD